MLQTGGSPRTAGSGCGTRDDTLAGIMWGPPFDREEVGSCISLTRRRLAGWVTFADRKYANSSVRLAVAVAAGRSRRGALGLARAGGARGCSVGDLVEVAAA